MGPFSFEEACALHGVHLRIYIGASLLGLRFLTLRHVFLDREAKKSIAGAIPCWRTRCLPVSGGSRQITVFNLTFGRAGPSSASPSSIPTGCGTSASSRSFDSLNWKVIVHVARYTST